MNGEPQQAIMEQLRAESIKRKRRRGSSSDGHNTVAADRTPE